MKKHRCELPEQWRDIPGFNGAYQASTAGNIRKIWQKSGKSTILTPYRKTARAKRANSRQSYVHIKLPEGRRIERSVIKLVAQTFIGIPDGKYPVHKNGICADNSLDNIAILSSEELGEIYGANAARRPVVKINSKGETIECYASARAAARENFISYQAVMNRCNGKIKKEFALDGYSYRWDD